MMVYVLVAFLLFGSSVVFSSRSPYFAIFGVLIQAISFSLLFCLFGYPMFGLLTVLIYVGGMLIIFLFSTVLSAERYPDSGWGELLLVTVSLWLLCLPVINTWGSVNVNVFSGLVLSSESNLGEVFNLFGIFSCLVVFVLLVALVVVLVFGYEHSQENLRKL